MTRFLIGRLLSAIPTLFVVTLATFLILWLVPGDISAEIGGIDATAEDLAAIRERLGLDRPLYERALLWYGNLLQGDLGHSYLLNRSVADAVLERLPVTLSLAGLALVIATAIGVGIYTVASSADEKATVRASLRQLEGYEVDNVRDQELLKPIGDRTVKPLLDRVNDLGRRFTPDGYVDKVRARLVSSGNTSPDAVDRFIAVKVVGFALAPVLIILVFGVLGMGGMMGIIVAALLAAIAIYGPDAILNRRVEERQNAIRTALPDVLDLLVISVEAGLGFEQALDRTVQSVPGPLTQEFARMLGEVRAGSSRADAMRAMERRTDVPELRSFVLAILQADTFGVSIGRVLRSQADEMRIKRRQLAQEKAQKAPVKMMIPMVFCVFPALFVVVIGPAIINITRSF